MYKDVIKVLFIILLINVFISSDAFSQKKYKRQICISEWIKEMENYQGQRYVLRNTEIYFDYEKDSLYSYNQSRDEPTDKDNDGIINIYPNIVIQDCKLPYNSTCQLRNIIFHKNIIFENCTGAGQIYIYNCTFKEGMDIFLSDFNTLQFHYSSILQRTIIFESRMSLLSYSNCSFYTDYRIVENNRKRGFETESHIYQYLFFIGQNEKKINQFNINNCNFLPTDVMPVFAFQGGKYDAINFQETDFKNCIVDFTACSVKESFTINNCNFNTPFGMHKFSFPKDNSSIHWSQIDSLGLGFYTTYDKPPYTHKTDTLITEVYFYNDLNSSYRKLFSMYRAQGDIESANACYVQMKDMETTKYRYLHHQNPSIKTWFNWRFNQFLKYFSEYGTNPVQSLIISMWTILVFAAVYFFFYSIWDGINRTFLIEQHRKIIKYFRSEQSLADFYSENYTEDFKSFANYKKEMEESRGEMPVFIILLGKPLYLLSIIRHKILTFIYQRTEILHGRWLDLNTIRKVYVVIAVFVWITVYLIYLVLIRAINSITLSINVFSTLGFGAIPVKGISRYITILEGFLGWFLLSIFSVSLISQMLQN